MFNLIREELDQNQENDRSHLKHQTNVIYANKQSFVLTQGAIIGKKTQPNPPLRSIGAKPGELFSVLQFQHITIARM